MVAGDFFWNLELIYFYFYLLLSKKGGKSELELRRDLLALALVVENLDLSPLGIEFCHLSIITFFFF